MRSLLCVMVCIFALLGCGERRALDHIAALSHPDAKVRQDASYALIELGRHSVEPLIASAASASASLKYISAQILGRIGDRSAIPFLRQLIQSSNISIRQEAVVALGQMGDQGLIPSLVEVLAKDSASQIRAAAAEGLGNLRDTLAVPPLVRALQDTVPLVRQRILTALHRLWTHQAEQAALSLLRDPDETIRFIAAQTLGVHRTSRARDPLGTALLDSSVWVRTEAARSLGLLGDTTAVELLVRLLKTRQGPDSQAARQALKALTGLDYEVVD